MRELMVLVWHTNEVALCERQATSVVCTPSFLCKLVESSGGGTLLLCSEEGQVKEFGSVVTWGLCPS